jgi:hypothetical protein
MIAGVFLGSTIWWLVLVALVGRLRVKLTMSHLRILRRGSALLLAAFAAYQLAA